MKCNERAGLVKTWLPVQYEGPKAWLDQLVYDRALVLVGSFAVSLLRLNATLFSHALRHGKNFLIKYQVLMSVRSCTKRAYGASMPCRRTCYKPVIHSWRKTEKPLLLVRLFFLCMISSWWFSF